MADTAKKIIATYDAVGGPAQPTMGSDGFMQHPTRKGEFVVAYCGKHSSTRYPYWSKVPWGTPLRKERGKLEVFMNGRWRPLSEYSSADEDNIKRYANDLTGRSEVPDKWIFNDFGHMTCYYFKDVNKNGKLDNKTESIMGDFIHTTPPDETKSSGGLPVILTESHGCIHVKPDDIDDMIKRGFIKKGNRIYIHDYSETTPSGVGVLGRAPYELHFYPGSKKIVIQGGR